MTSIPKLEYHNDQTMPQLGFGIWQVPQDIANLAFLAMRFFLTTKVWNNEQGRDKARASVERSLETIGVDRQDLVLIHWPVPIQDLYVKTWKAFVEMRDEGLMRSIGTSNFNADHLEQIIGETGEVPVLNQIELNPELQQPDRRAFQTAHGIVTKASTPLGNGRSFGAAALTEPAARTGKSPAQIVLRWHIQSGHAVSPARSNPTVRQKTSTCSTSNLQKMSWRRSAYSMSGRGPGRTHRSSR